MNTRLFKLQQRRSVLGYLTDSEKKEIAELELQQSKEEIKTMTTNIIRAIETASKECNENDNPMSVYFDTTQGTWLTAYAEDFGTIDGKVNFEVVSSGVRYPFDERLISQINSVDDEAIAALQEAGEIEEAINDSSR
jgi:hypothetical protein